MRLTIACGILPSLCGIASAQLSCGEFVDVFRADPPVANDFFGESAAISGGHFLVGMFGRDTVASGAGAADAFAFDGAVWSRVDGLFAPDGGVSDFFGTCVALTPSGVAVAGAWGHDADINGEGAAYVFVRDEFSEYAFAQKLTASDMVPNDNFGYDADIHGDTIIVGARGVNIGPLGNAGAAYIFRNIEGVWLEQAKRFALDASANDQFGAAVAIGDGVAMAGSANIAADPIVGAVYVYSDNDSVWPETQKLVPPDAPASQQFGFSIAIDGDVAIIGAPGDDIDNLNPDAGAAYVYRFDAGSGMWLFEDKLVADDRFENDRLGHAVDVSGDLAIVGAPGDHFELDDNVDDVGAAYLFEHDGGVWSQIGKLTIEDPDEFDQFGWSVSIDGTDIVVGSGFVDHKGAFNTGAAYVFSAECVGPCSPADLDLPFNQLDFSDVTAFLIAFGAEAPEADLALPEMQWDFSDIVAFLTIFGEGCP